MTAARVWSILRLYSLLVGPGQSFYPEEIFSRTNLSPTY